MAHRQHWKKSARKSAEGGKRPAAGSLPKTINAEDRERIFDAFRAGATWKRTLDPPGLFEPLKHADLDALTGEAAEEARRIYCGYGRRRFHAFAEPERRRWITERLEAPASEVDQHKILERLIRADLFEQVCRRATSAPSDSLEGVTALFRCLIPPGHAGERGALESIMAMSHRSPERDGPRGLQDPA